MEIIKLLESKNRCLKKILDFSVQFLSQTETGDFSQLAQFQAYRDATLKTISLLDKKLTEIISLLPPSQKTPEFIEQAKAIYQKENDLIGKIIEIDQFILSQIQLEKTRLTQEIASSEKNSQAVKKFKSTWVAESGETLDGKI
jgi:hypothetical protein